MIVDKILRVIRVAGTPGPTNDFWYEKILSFGTNITADSAMQTTAVFACVGVRARLVAMLPLRVMEETADGRRRKATEHPWYRVLYRQPNQWQTAYEFREMMEGHVALRGNAYAAKVSRPKGMQLIPLHPDRMRVFPLDSGRLGYLFRKATGESVPLTQDDIFHLRGLSTDGVIGASPIELCRRAVELAQQGEDHGVKFYRNAGKPGGVLQLPAGETIKDEDDLKRLKAEWHAAQSGDNVYQVAILENGMEWKAIGLSNADAQHLESRRFQVPEICRIFNVPPHTVYSAIEHGHTYANVEQSDLALVKHTGIPRYVAWEQSIQRDLLEDPFYAKFAVDALLRADSMTRANFYDKMKRMGVLSVNEIRELEDLNPIDGGNEYDETVAPAIGSPAAVVVRTEPADAGAATIEVSAEYLELLQRVEGKVDKVGGKVDDCHEAIDAVGTGVGQTVEGIADLKRGQRDTATAIDQGNEQQQAASAGIAYTIEDHHRQTQVALADSASKLEELADNRDWYNESIEEAAACVAGAQAADLAKHAKHADSDRERFNTWVADYFGGKAGQYMADKFRRFVPASEVKAAASKLATVVVGSADPVKLTESWKTDCAAVLAEHFTKGKTDE
ncbi:MAG: phage portal protein [Bacilli bacterium]